MMKLTFLDHLAVIEPQLSPVLFSGSNIRALLDLAACFPFDAATDFGFESRLGDPKGECDFFLQIRKGSEGALALAGRSRIGRLSGALTEDPFWKQLSLFFAEWVTPGTLFHQSVSLVWLEFDHGPDGYNPVPNIFLRIDDATGASRQQQAETLRQVLGNLYGILFGIGFPGDLAGRMQQCVEELPGNTGIYQTGFMIPRKTEAIRLILTGMKPDLLYNYLDRIGWPGDTDSLQALLSRYLPLVDYSVFNLHTGKNVLPFLGAELYLRDMKQPNWEPAWRKLLDNLEDDRLILRAKREELVHFSSKRKSTFPVSLLYLNGINHLKLVYKQGEPPECKGYFGTMIRDVSVVSRRNPD